MFSNTGNANQVRWQTYVKGDPIRQEIPEPALNWASGSGMHRYMAEHRNDDRIDELRNIECILGGESDKKHLNIRVFHKKTIRSVYGRQTSEAKVRGMSNCPLCASSGQANRDKHIYKETEMDADHVTAWSRGGSTDESNCQMLCKPQNRSKGNL